jgi:hypothetical protein
LLGNPESTRRFKVAWEALPKATVRCCATLRGGWCRTSSTCWPTGALPWPDYIIGGVGTQIYDGRRKRPLNEFNQRFRDGWDLSKIEAIVGSFPGSRPAAATVPASLQVELVFDTSRGPKPSSALEKQLADAGLHVTVVYSSARDLDVLPMDTNKGAAH